MNSNVTAKYGKLMHVKRYFGIMLNNLNKQRGDSMLCDVDFIIGAQGKRISAHRCIMAAASPYFTAMFASSFNESKQREVVIQDVDADDFELLVEFCYSATIHINNGNAKRILQAAHCFQFSDIITACCQYLKGQMDPSTCLGIANLAEYLDLKELYDTAMEFTIENFGVVSKQDEFLLLDVEMVSEMLQRDDLVVCNEDDVFRAMLAWVQYDTSERAKFTSALLKMIRITHLNISSTIDDLKRLSSTMESKNLLIDALTCQLVPQRRKDIENLGISTKSRKYTNGGKLIAIGNRQFVTERTVIEIYCPVDNKWTVTRTFNKRVNFSATIMNNKLVIAGGQKPNGESLNSVLMYDLKTFELDKLPPMTEKRFSFNLCFLDGCLYAVGGLSNNNVERFCFNENLWRFVPPLTPQRSGFAATVFCNCLYVIGGKIDDSGLTNRIDCFDPSISKWTSRASMAFNRNNPAVTVNNGFLYVYSADSLERYDPTSNSWIILSVPKFSIRYLNRYLFKKTLILFGLNEETEVNEDNVEIEEFEEIEEDDEDEVAVGNQVIERFEVNTTSRSDGIRAIGFNERSETIAVNQGIFLTNNDYFDEKVIKKYCLESDTVTLLPVMSVIKKVEFLIQIPTEI